MEHGFFHSDHGYWQTTNQPTSDTLSGYPEGTIEVPLMPGAGYEWRGKWVYVAPDPAEVLAAERAQASAAMIQRIEQFTAQFTSKYPSAEVAYWGTQAAEAKAVLAGGSSVVIAAFAAARGVSEMEMAQRIAAKSAAYMTIIGKVAGLRDATFDAIEAAETPEQIQAVLDGALAQAQGMAQAMGLEF